MHRDVEGGRHRPLPHKDLGGPKLAINCWGSGSTHGASAIGTK